MSTENDNIQRIEIFTGHNEKYNIDYKYVKAMFSGSTCEFEYKGKKYGFTSHSKFKDATIKNSKNCTTKMELMSEGENVDRELEKIVDYLELNEKEKKNKVQFDEIDVKNYYLLIVSNKENCFFCDTEVGNKDLEINAYEHGGIMSDYYIVNYHNKKTKDVCGFSYLIRFRTLDFDALPGNDGIFFKNVGDECLFLRFGNRIIFIRPGEQLEYCGKNFVKDKIRVPECCGREIEEFLLYNYSEEGVMRTYVTIRFKDVIKRLKETNDLKQIKIDDELVWNVDEYLNDFRENKQEPNYMYAEFDEEKEPDKLVVSSRFGIGYDFMHSLIDKYDPKTMEIVYDYSDLVSASILSKEELTGNETMTRKFVFTKNGK